MVIIDHPGATCFWHDIALFRIRSQESNQFYPFQMREHHNRIPQKTWSLDHAHRRQDHKYYATLLA